jgi:hypothetical protein
MRGQSGTDDDADGTLDSADNCIGYYNPDQADDDRNGLGDACDCDDCIYGANEGNVDCGGICPSPCNISVCERCSDWEERAWIIKNIWSTNWVSQAGATPIREGCGKVPYGHDWRTQTECGGKSAKNETAVHISLV